MSDSYVFRWFQFARERFEPVSHLALIGLFVAAHGAVAEGISAAPIRWDVFLTIFLGSLAFFFKLRLYDEIKDYEVDLEFNPTRPLARGLLRQSDLKWAIGICILIELVAFGSRGLQSLLAASVAILYSLLMYNEFFIGPKIRPLLTTYAVSHTFVSVLLSWALLRGMIGHLGVPGTNEVLFALNSWCLFNIFEFGRKTFASGEERDRVPSYSKVFGRYGAVVLVLAMGGCSTFLIWKGALVTGPMTFGVLLLTLGLIGAFGFLYATLDRKPWGGLYRGLSSVYILIVYAVIAVSHLAQRSY